MGEAKRRMNIGPVTRNQCNKYVRFRHLLHIISPKMPASYIHHYARNRKLI